MYYHVCYYTMCSSCLLTSCSCQEKIINGLNYMDNICPHCGSVKYTSTITTNSTEKYTSTITTNSTDYIDYNNFTPDNTTMTKKLRPCDCKDQATANKLNEQGIGHNDQSIMIEPNSVVLTMGHTTLKIPMATFEIFAKWYLEEQEI